MIHYRDQKVRPSLEALAKMADEKKTGGVFAGQRRGIVIIDAPSHEELGKTLASLPFWSGSRGMLSHLNPTIQLLNGIEEQWKSKSNIAKSILFQPVPYSIRARKRYPVPYLENGNILLLSICLRRKIVSCQKKMRL